VGVVPGWPGDELGVVEVLVGVVDVVVGVVVVGVDTVGVVTVGVVLVLVLGWQEAVTLWYETPAGTIWAGGVPGGASTTNVSVCPVSNTTVTVHVSAEALGNAATAIVTRANAKVVAPIFSFRLLDTLS
jgi:hypothetical protein